MHPDEDDTESIQGTLDKLNQYDESVKRKLGRMNRSEKETVLSFSSVTSTKSWVASVNEVRESICLTLFSSISSFISYF